MYTLKHSQLFLRQWREYAQYYDDKGGAVLSDKLIDAVTEALQFIERHPMACAVYDAGEMASSQLKSYVYRKWSLTGFPFTVFFHIHNEHIIMVDGLYAQQMNITERLN